MERTCARMRPTPHGPMTDKEAAEFYGLSVSTIRWRRCRGWPQTHHYLPALREFSLRPKSKDLIGANDVKVVGGS